MTNHTPGPWAILDLGTIKRIYVSGGEIVADVKGERRAGNASLIAAVPKMLAALQEIYRLEMGGPAGNIAEEILKQLGEL